MTQIIKVNTCDILYFQNTLSLHGIHFQALSQFTTVNAIKVVLQRKILFFQFSQKRLGMDGSFSACGLR